MSASLAARETITLASLDYPPYVYEHDKEVRGFSVSLVRELFAQTDVELQIKVYPWKRALRKAQSGEVDGIFPALKTAERETYLTYLDHPLSTETVTLFHHVSMPLQYDEALQFLQNRTLCIQRGFSVGSRIDALFANKLSAKVAVRSQNDCVRLLLRRPERIFVSDRRTGLFAIQQMNPEGELVPMSTPMQETPVYLAFSRKNASPEFIDRLNQILREHITNGTWHTAQAKAELIYLRPTEALKND